MLLEDANWALRFVSKYTVWLNLCVLHQFVVHLVSHLTSQLLECSCSLPHFGPFS